MQQQHQQQQQQQPAAASAAATADSTPQQPRKQKQTRNSNGNNNNHHHKAQRGTLAEIAALIANRNDPTALAVKAILEGKPTAGAGGAGGGGANASQNAPPPPAAKLEAAPRETDSDHPWQRQVRARLRETSDGAEVAALLAEAESRNLAHLAAHIRRKMRLLEQQKNN